MQTTNINFNTTQDNKAIALGCDHRSGDSDAELVDYHVQ
jgi:hypothetical protein